MILKIQNSNCDFTKYQIKTIDLLQCKSDNEVFNAFAKGLEFPDWFEYNWDAFNDCMLNLCFDVDGALVIDVFNCEESFHDSLVNIDWLIETVVAMVLGETTQDNGEQIQVIFNLFFNNKNIIESIKKTIEHQYPSLLSINIEN